MNAPNAAGVAAWMMEMTMTAKIVLGTLVRFNHSGEGGPVHRIVSVMKDGMVEIHDMGGYFAPHLFTIADDIADIPPSPPPELVRIEGDDIVIRISLDALVFATEQGCLCTFSKLKNDFRTVHVHDPAQWRDAIVRALRREKENGDTPVHLMLDDALEYAADQGEEGVSIEGILP
ncbi:MAG TPA: hypothetical protein VGM38_09430 [Pseudolysinimonas sp.]